MEVRVAKEPQKTGHDNAAGSITWSHVKDASYRVLEPKELVYSSSIIRS
jgi:hypothetical protein